MSLLLVGSEPVPAENRTKELLLATGSCYLPSFGGIFPADILIHVPRCAV